MKIDVTYNFQAETEPRDADRFSSKLQEYHRILWSKPLPNGKVFKLAKIRQNRLYHKSDLGEFYLSSDRAVATFSNRKRLQHLILQIPKSEVNSFCNITETIGAIIIWPSNRIGQFQTINGARGFNSKINDRLDLTLECIRRYYLNQENPLYETFNRYNAFFSLFEDFKGYVDFFLFQDAVSSNYSSVNIASPFDNFESSPVPKSVKEYTNYMADTVSFVQARNSRIDKLGL